jgi:hypothetical protein
LNSARPLRPKLSFFVSFQQGVLAVPFEESAGAFHVERAMDFPRAFLRVSYPQRHHHDEIRIVLDTSFRVWLFPGGIPI